MDSLRLGPARPSVSLCLKKDRLQIKQESAYVVSGECLKISHLYIIWSSEALLVSEAGRLSGPTSRVAATQQLEHNGLAVTRARYCSSGAGSLRPSQLGLL